MTYRIEWRPHARKAFLALDKPVRRRIGEAVEAWLPIRARPLRR